MTEFWGIFLFIHLINFKFIYYNKAHILYNKILYYILTVTLKLITYMYYVGIFNFYAFFYHFQLTSNLLLYLTQYDIDITTWKLFFRIKSLLHNRENFVSVRDVFISIIS